MMDVFAAVVVVATFCFIVRSTEVRLALLAGGAVLAIALLNAQARFNALAASTVRTGLLTAILPAIGFTSAIKLAKYDHHLVRRIIGPLLSLRAVIVPAPMIGTFGIAMLSGSRDATAIAFNKAVLPHAEAIAMEQLDLGSIAWLGGGLGRSMSPVAAATAMAAGYAGVSVFDIAKRTAVPALSVAVLVVIILEVIG